MRYYLDTEYDGWGGPLLSLALVSEDGDDELYLKLHHEAPLTDWVARHVAPFLDHVPAHLQTPPLTSSDAAQALVHFLGHDPDVTILADWPEDLAHLARLLVTGPGVMVPVPSLRLELVMLPGFSTAANSAVPHNALHDARALRAACLA